MQELALKAMVASADGSARWLGRIRAARISSTRGLRRERAQNVGVRLRRLVHRANGTGNGQRTVYAEVFVKRSRNWQNLFDPDTRFMQPRRNGGWFEPFDPYEVNFHYTEANAWQYSMFAPHDVEYLMRSLGGLDALHDATGQPVRHLQPYYRPRPGRHHRPDRTVRARQRAEPPHGSALWCHTLHVLQRKRARTRSSPRNTATPRADLQATKIAAR